MSKISLCPQNEGIVVVPLMGKTLSRLMTSIRVIGNGVVATNITPKATLNLQVLSKLWAVNAVIRSAAAFTT
jgi:hypothetical protein